MTSTSKWLPAKHGCTFLVATLLMGACGNDALNVAPEFLLTVLLEGSGAVGSDPEGLSCGDVCEHSFAPNTMVELSARAMAEWTFLRWEGGCAGYDCELDMDRDHTVVAIFGAQDDPNYFSLNVELAGSGEGFVKGPTSGSSPISCGDTCTSYFVDGTTVELVADPLAGSTFFGWAGDCTGTDPTCVVTVDAVRNVIATFVREEPVECTLTVELNGNGMGSVQSNPASIDCGSSCTAAFAAATMVELTATPSPNSVFEGWSGACVGMTTCSVVMDTARHVVATFVAEEWECARPIAPWTTVTVYEKTEVLLAETFTIGEVMDGVAEFSTGAGEQYSISRIGSCVKINCHRGRTNGVGNNLTGVRLGFVTQSAEMWAANIVSYELGSDGVDDTRFAVLGDDLTDNTYLGNDDSEIIVSFQ